jgi:hypothetical protein
MVAQFKMTVICTLDGPLRLTTSAHPLPYVHSTWSLDSVPELATLIQIPVTEARKESINQPQTDNTAIDMDL